MIRGHHVDVAIMAGLQVDEAGNLANWAVPGKPLLGVGGAMDLASGAEKLIITMTHTDRTGQPKLVPKCTLPITANGVVDVVITELGVFRFTDGELRLEKAMPGVSLADIEARTAASSNLVGSLGASLARRDQVATQLGEAVRKCNSTAHIKAAEGF